MLLYKFLCKRLGDISKNIIFEKTLINNPLKLRTNAYNCENNNRNYFIPLRKFMIVKLSSRISFTTFEI